MKIMNALTRLYFGTVFLLTHSGGRKTKTGLIDTHAKWAGREETEEQELQSLLLDIRQRVTSLREHVEEQTKALEADLDAVLGDEHNSEQFDWLRRAEQDN